MRNKTLIKTFFIIYIFAAINSQWAAAKTEAANPMQDAEIRHLQTGDSISDMLDHPSLAAFSEHLLPSPQDARSGLKLDDVARLMPWHSHVRPQVVVNALNRLIEDSAKGLPVFFAFHADASARGRTGLFFFRGRPE